MRRVAEGLARARRLLLRAHQGGLLALVDALMGDPDACELLLTTWRPAVSKLAVATRATCVRHAWVLRSPTGAHRAERGCAISSSRSRR